MIVNQPMKHSVTESNTLIISCLTIIGILSIVSLLSFKNRKLQLLLTSLNFLAIGLLISLLFVFSLGMDYFGPSGTSSFKNSLGLILLIISFNVLAFRGIKKDEELIRSMDRLR
jgi:amino acid permease